MWRSGNLLPQKTTCCCLALEPKLLHKYLQELGSLFPPCGSPVNVRHQVW